MTKEEGGECMDEAVQLAVRVINQCNRLPVGRSRRRLIQDATDELCAAVERGVLAARAAARERAKSAIDATHGASRVMKRQRRNIELDSSDSDDPEEERNVTSRTWKWKRAPRRGNRSNTPLSLEDSSSGEESDDSGIQKRLRSSTRRRRRRQRLSPSPPANVVQTRSRTVSLPSLSLSSDPEDSHRNTRRSSRLASVAAAAAAKALKQSSESEKEQEEEEPQSDESNENGSQSGSDAESEVSDTVDLVLPVVRPRPFVKPKPLSSDWASNTPHYSTDDEDTDEEADINRRRARDIRILSEDQTERLRPLIAEIENAPVELSEPETESDKNDADWRPEMVPSPSTESPLVQPLNSVHNVPPAYPVSAPVYPQSSRPVMYHPSQAGTRQMQMPIHPSVSNTAVRYAGYHRMEQTAGSQTGALGQSMHVRSMPNTMNVQTPSSNHVNNVAAYNAMRRTANSALRQPSANFNTPPQVSPLTQLHAQQQQVPHTLTQSIGRTGMPQNGILSPAVTQAGTHVTGNQGQGQSLPQIRAQQLRQSLPQIQAQQLRQYQALARQNYLRIEAAQQSQLRASQKAEAHARESVRSNMKADEETRKLLELEAQWRKQLETHRQAVRNAKALANAHAVEHRKALVEASNFARVRDQLVRQSMIQEQHHKQNQQRIAQMIILRQNQSQTETALGQIEVQFQQQIPKTAQPTSSNDKAAISAAVRGVSEAAAQQGTQMQKRIEELVQPSNKLVSLDLSESTLTRYKQSGNEVGVRLVASPESYVRSQDARNNFVADHSRYMASIAVHLRPRLIDNVQVDLYTLYKIVLQLGGLQNVIWQGLFTQVSQALKLSYSPAVGKFLREAYTNDLYAYEQKHVWGRDLRNLPNLFEPEVKNTQEMVGNGVGNQENAVNGTNQGKGNGREMNGGAAAVSITKGPHEVGVDTPDVQVVDAVMAVNHGQRESAGMT